MQWALLRLTDGTTSIDLLGGVFRLQEWLPTVAGPKGGGVWRDSPLSDGRSLVHRRFENAIETLTLTVSGDTQERVIRETQDLRDLLEQAVQYWTARVPAASLVWIEARAQMETNTRYAYIYDYRTPNDGDPYGATFNPLVPPFAFTKWQLFLERGPWQSHAPGSSACLALDNLVDGYTYAANLVLNSSFESAGGGGADVFALWSEVAGDGAIAQEAATVFHLTKSAKLTAGATANTLINQDIAVVAGATYVFSVWARGSDRDYGPRIKITDLSHGSAELVPLTAVKLSNATEWFHYSVVFTAPAGCVLVRVILYCPAANGKIGYVDYVSVCRATPVSFGRAATCAAEVYGANHTARTQITHAYYYDTSAGTFSGNRQLGVPNSLLPPAPDVGDLLYIGVDLGALDSGPFTNLIFDLKQVGPAGAAVQGVWECWTGAAWVAITTIRDYTGTSGNKIDQTGVHGLMWQIQAGWTPTTVNTIFAWWVRLRVTGVSGGVPVPQQQNRLIYTANQPLVSAGGAGLQGNLPALAKHMVRGLGVDPIFAMKEFILWTRSKSRGANFSPFINISDTQIPAGISFYGDVLTGGDIPFVISEYASTGRDARYSPAGVDTSYIGIEIDSPLCNDYFGVFRAFCRVKQTGGVAGDFSVYLLARTNARQQGRTVYYTDTSGLIDLGSFTFPQKSLGGHTDLSRFLLELHLANSNAAPGTLDIYDLILVPVDECAVQIINPYDWGAITVDEAAELDSTYPGEMITATDYDDTRASPVAFASYTPIATGPLTLAPGEDQFIGILFTKLPDPCLVWNDQVHHVDRYLSMRGDR